VKKGFEFIFQETYRERDEKPCSVSLSPFLSLALSFSFYIYQFIFLSLSQNHPLISLTLINFFDSTREITAIIKANAWQSWQQDVEESSVLLRLFASYLFFTLWFAFHGNRLLSLERFHLRCYATALTFVMRQDSLVTTLTTTYWRNVFGSELILCISFS